MARKGVLMLDVLLARPKQLDGGSNRLGELHCLGNVIDGPDVEPPAETTT
jgi:hypothetical protein